MRCEFLGAALLLVFDQSERLKTSVGAILKSNFENFEKISEIILENEKEDFATTR